MPKRGSERRLSGMLETKDYISCIHNRTSSELGKQPVDLARRAMNRRRRYVGGRLGRGPPPDHVVQPDDPQRPIGLWQGADTMGRYLEALRLEVGDDASLVFVQELDVLLLVIATARDIELSGQNLNVLGAGKPAVVVKSVDHLSEMPSVRCTL